MVSRILENITVTITRGQLLGGHPHTNLYIEWDEGGIRRAAISRVAHVIDDTAYGRAAAIAAFKKRQGVT